jgi:hypothetical protein
MGTCAWCGAPTSSRCPECTRLALEHSLRDVYACGGCGVAFLVAPRTRAEPITIGGVSRMFCACCLVFLAPHLPAGAADVDPGYDVEGRSLNLRFPKLLPSEKIQHRKAAMQAHLASILNRRSAGTASAHPLPLLL